MKVLIVGLGGIGQRHLRNLSALCPNGLEVSAFRTRRRADALNDRLQVEPGVDVEARFDVAVHETLDAALDAKPDLVFVCNPSSLHVPTALAAVRAGCHVFIEKPLSHSYDGVGELIAAAARARVVAVVGYQLRFHPCVLRMRALLARGAIGRVVGIRAHVGEYLPAWHVYEDYREMYASRRDLGGGVILAQIHELDYLYWCFGLPRRVFAVGGHLSSLDIDVEDTASMLFEGVVDGRVVPIHVHADYVQRPPSRGCEVIGDAGKIIVDLHALTVRAYGADGSLFDELRLEQFERNDPFLDELRHFLACVRGEAEPLVPIREGAQSLRMALGAAASLAAGAVVELA